MLKCYIDDSGSDVQEDGVFVLAGYMMEELRWEDFAEKWDVQLKRDPPIEYCRMANAEGGGGPFAGIDSAIRRMKVRDLAKVIESCNPTPITLRLHWSQYNRVVKGKVREEMDNPYAILFFQALRGACELQIMFNEAINGAVGEGLVLPPGVEIAHKPVEFIFDNQGTLIEAQCLKWYFELREKLLEPHRTMVRNTPRFLDDRAVTPLQASDMIAWHIRREHQFPEEKRDILGVITMGGVWEKDIQEEDLQAIVEALNR